MGKPYWIWRIGRIPIESRRTIGLDDFFVLLLSRLAWERYDVRPVVRVLARMNDRETAELAEAFDAVERDGRETACERLRELSRGLFQRLGAVRADDAGRMQGTDDAGQSAGDDAGQDVRELATELDKLLARFKDDILRRHVRYFEGDGMLEPVQLGSLLLCVRGLECAIAALRNPADDSREPFGVDSEALAAVLDWDGKTEFLLYEFWRRDLGDIADDEEEG